MEIWLQEIVLLLMIMRTPLLATMYRLLDMKTMFMEIIMLILVMIFLLLVVDIWYTVRKHHFVIGFRMRCQS